MWYCRSIASRYCKSRFHIYVSAEFVDVDNDGDLDLILAKWGDPYIPDDQEPLTDRLLLNDGKGYFTDAPQGAMPKKLYSGDWSGATDITPIDVNEDGFMDLILADWSGLYTETKLQPLMNDGSGRFTDETNLIAGNDGMQIHCGYVITSDLDGDGLMDFVTCARSYYSMGNSFNAINDDSPNDLADMNGDGLPDLINLTSINDEFNATGQPELIGGLQGTIILDADMDGDNDVFIIQEAQDGSGQVALSIKLLLNDGTGQYSYANDNIFTPAPPTFFFSGQQKAVDFNGDGLTDIFIQESGTDSEPYPDGQNRILIHKPDGTFADETLERLPIHNHKSHGCTVGDIDNDEDIDIHNNSITGGEKVFPSLLINDGNEFFTEAW